MGIKLDIPQNERLLRGVNGNCGYLGMVTVVFLVVGFLGDSIEVVFSPLDRVVEAVHDKVFFLKLVYFFLKEPLKYFGLSSFSLLHHVNLATSPCPNVLDKKIVHINVLKRLSCYR